MASSTQNSSDENFFILKEMNTEFFALPGLPSVGFEDSFDDENSQNIFKNGRDSRQMCMFASEDFAGIPEECRDNYDPTLQNPGFELHRDMWVMPMLGLSAMNVLVILAFEIFVICKATGNSPSRR